MPTEQVDVSRKSPASTGIIYNAELGSIPRNVVLDFLNECSAQLMDQNTIRNIVQKYSETHEPLQTLIVEYQRNVLEFQFNIEKDFGCRYLSLIPRNFAGDKELENAAKRFMFVCMKAFVDALRLHGAEYVITLKTDGGMTPDVMSDFFEGCNALMTLPETKVLLKQTYETTKKPPNEKVIELQRSVLNMLGYDADYAISCLNTFPKDYPMEESLLKKMQTFALCAQVAVKEATMTMEERRYRKCTSSYDYLLLLSLIFKNYYMNIIIIYY